MRNSREGWGSLLSLPRSRLLRLLLPLRFWGTQLGFQGLLSHGASLSPSLQGNSICHQRPCPFCARDPVDTPPLQATHLWRAKASCLAWRWQRRRRRASRANHSSEPAAAMTAGCRRARTTPVLPAVTSARAWLMSPLCHCCVLPPHAPSWSPSPTQDTAGGIAGDPQPCAVECGHLDAVSGPGDRQGDLQAVGASVHCPVGGV